MPDVYESYRTFISSPGDVAEERGHARDVIDHISQNCRETLGLSLEARTWEDMPPVSPHLPEERIQDVLNKEVERSHFFILILFRRYGTIESGQTKSNTERELDTILEQFAKRPHVKILAYFRRLPENEDQGLQEQKVRDFRQRLHERGVLSKTYDTPADFKDLLTHDLYDVVMRMRLSPYKRAALQRFWRLGEVDPPTHPRLAILFPPVSREAMGNNSKGGLWHRRLHPNMYYEDYKAIHKITKTLALIGFHDYRTYFQTDPPTDLPLMNRVWVCFGRSNQALQRIEANYRHARFRFPLRKGNAIPGSWFHADGRAIRLKSPLPLYLRTQRPRAAQRGPWNQQLGKVVCRDFGILARFKDTASEDRTSEGALHDYFIGGIHGLGTWGAGWFLDRKFKSFLQVPEDADTQYLLAVTYHDGRIVSIEDVSNHPPEYFAEELTPRKVKETIAQYRS